MLKKTKLTLIKSERKESSEETKIFQKKNVEKAPVWERSSTNSPTKSMSV